MVITWRWGHIGVTLYVALLIAIVFINGMGVDSYWFTLAPKSGPLIYLHVFQHFYSHCEDCIDVWKYFSLCRNYDPLFLSEGGGSPVVIWTCIWKVRGTVRISAETPAVLSYTSFLSASLIKFRDITSARSRRFPSKSFPVHHLSTIEGWAVYILRCCCLHMYKNNLVILLIFPHSFYFLVVQITIQCVTLIQNIS
jgi:hypothetical protein